MAFSHLHDFWLRSKIRKKLEASIFWLAKWTVNTTKARGDPEVFFAHSCPHSSMHYKFGMMVLHLCTHSLECSCVFRPLWKLSASACVLFGAVPWSWIPWLELESPHKGGGGSLGMGGWAVWHHASAGALFKWIWRWAVTANAICMGISRFPPGGVIPSPACMRLVCVSSLC
jgi:hypothetical protein